MYETIICCVVFTYKYLCMINEPQKYDSVLDNNNNNDIRCFSFC